MSTIRATNRATPIAVHSTCVGAAAAKLVPRVLGLQLEAEVEAVDHHQPEPVEQHGDRQQQRVGVGRDAADHQVRDQADADRHGGVGDQPGREVPSRAASTAASAATTISTAKISISSSALRRVGIARSACSLGCRHPSTTIRVRADAVRRSRRAGRSARRVGRAIRPRTWPARDRAGADARSSRPEFDSASGAPAWSLRRRCSVRAATCDAVRGRPTSGDWSSTADAATATDADVDVDADAEARTSRARRRRRGRARRLDLAVQPAHDPARVGLVCGR